MSLRESEKRATRTGSASTARDVMTPDVLTCSPNDTLSRAAQLMWEGDVGCVPVVAEDSKPVGMITDRDICMATYLRAARPEQARVADAMSKSLYAVGENEPLGRVEQTMQERQIRRVPVVNAQGKLVGIVSLNDLALLAGGPGAGGRISLEEVAQTLRAVCEPHKARSVPSH